MTSVTFPTHLGGSGITISDDAGPRTGLLNDGHQRLFVPGLRGVVDMATYVNQYAQAIDGAKASADRAQDAKGYVLAVAAAHRINLLSAYKAVATADLDFARGLYSVDNGSLKQTTSLNNIFSVFRATPKTVEGPSGALRSAGQNTVAREWRDGAPRGVLIEETRTNLLLMSDDLTAAPWTVGDGYIVSNDVFQNPYGGSKTSKISPAAGVDSFSSSVPEQAVSKAGAQVVYTFSALVKSAGSNGLRLSLRGASGMESCSAFFNLMTGVQSREAESTGSFQLLSARSRFVGMGWLLVSVSCVSNSDPIIFGRFFSYNELGESHFGDGVSGVYVAGSQLEEGGTATSRIQTEHAQSTRIVDTIESDVDINIKSFTVYARTYDIVNQNDPQRGSVFRVDAGDSSNSGNRLVVEVFPEVRMRLQPSDSADFLSLGNVYPTGGMASVALSVDCWNKTIKLSANGVLRTARIYDSRFFESLKTLRIYQGPSSRRINAMIDNILLIPSALSDSELEELTA